MNQIACLCMIVFLHVGLAENKVVGHKENADIGKTLSELTKQIKELSTSVKLIEGATNDWIDQQKKMNKNLMKEDRLLEGEIEDLSKRLEQLRRPTTQAPTTTSPPHTSQVPTTRPRKTGSQTCSKEPIYYPPETMDHQVWRCYPKNNLYFYDFGVANKFDKLIYEYGLSFEQCIHHCTMKRMKDGPSWKDMLYRWDDGLCECLKNAKGHHYFNTLLRYRFGDN